MRDLRTDVDHELAPVERVEILLERLPVPREPLGERGSGNVLDTFHQLDQPLVTVGCRRREPDAAVTHHHRGHPVPRRRREVRIPRRLSVVVRVDVDPAGGDELAGGVDDTCRLAHIVDRAGVDHGGDHPVVHHHVGDAAGSTGAVHHESPTDHEIMHLRKLLGVAVPFDRQGGQSITPTAHGHRVSGTRDIGTETMRSTASCYVHLHREASPVRLARRRHDGC